MHNEKHRRNTIPDTTRNRKCRRSIAMRIADIARDLIHAEASERRDNINAIGEA